MDAVPNKGASSRGIRAATILKSVAKRIVNPLHLFRAVRLHASRKHRAQVHDDPQLTLYAQILPGDFLHYGYFDDPDVSPEEMSISDIARAQLRYAHFIADHILDHESPVLDIGCGMGGLLQVLRERQFLPVGLTPDRSQLRYLRSRYEDIPLIESRFEDLAAESHAGRYGTVVTAESLQYIELDKALPLLEAILKPGGRWVACDYFRKKVGHEKSGHGWDEFVAKINGSGWRIVHEREITSNILPTLRYVHMWAGRLAVPLLHYGLDELRRKEPGIHYLLEEALERLQSVVAYNLQIIDPASFAEHKKYMFLVIEKTSYAGRETG